MNLYDIVTIKNPDTEEIEVRHDGKSYGTLKPGEIKPYPRFLAALTTKHLVDQILMKTNVSMMNNPAKRQEIVNTIIVSENMLEEDTRTEQQIIQDQIDKLQKSTELDQVLGNKTRVPKANLEEDEPQPEPEPEAAPDSPPSPDSQTDDVGNVTFSDPQRQQLFEYAKNELKMDISHQETLDKFKTAPVEELAQELGYEA